MEIKMNTPEPQEPHVAQSQSPVEQFKQGHTPQLQMTPEQLDAHKDQVMKEVKKDLPFLRLKEEYDRLQVAQLEQQVLLGQRSTKEVPGLLGLELQVREVQALEFLTQWKMEMENRMKGAEEYKKEQEKAKASMDAEATANKTTQQKEGSTTEG